MSRIFHSIIVMALMGYQVGTPFLFSEQVLPDFTSNEVERPATVTEVNDVVMIKKPNRRITSDERKEKKSLKKIKEEMGYLQKSPRFEGGEASSSLLGQKMKCLSGTLLCGTVREIARR